MNNTNHFTNILKFVLIITGMVFIGIIFISNIVVYVISKSVVCVLPVILIIIILYIFSCHSKSKAIYFAIEVFVIAFILKTLFAVHFNPPQTSDFEKIYTAALKAAKGNFSFSSDWYFRLWSYQTGIVAYYAGLIKLFGQGIAALKIINCIYISGTNVLIYLIARKLSNEKCARFAALLYIFYPATYFYVSVLTNQHISNFLILAGVYILMCRQQLSPSNSIFSAILLALGNAMRPQAIVVIAAVTVTIMLEIVTDIKNKKINIRLIKSVVSFLLIYVIVSQGLSFAVKESGMNKNGLENTFPLYKFAVGLNYKTNGTYSQDDTRKLVSISDPIIRNKKAFEIINETLSNPGKLAKLFVAKQVVMWSVLDYTTDFGFGYLQDTGVTILGKNLKYDTFINGFLNLEKNFYIFILILFTFGVVKGYRHHPNTRLATTVLLIILLNFAVYTVIEVQPRYRDFQMMFIFITAAVGVDSLFNQHPYPPLLSRKFNS